MFSDRKILVIRQAEKLAEEDWQKIVSAFQNSSSSTKDSDTTCVVAVFAEKLDLRKKSSKIYSELSHHIDFKKVYENELPNWIRYIAKNLGVQISDDAVNEMSLKLSHHLFEIEWSLKKIIDFKNYLNPLDEIQLQDVQEVLKTTIEKNVFELVDSVLEKNPDKALLIWRNLVSQSDSSIGAVTLMSRRFQTILELIQLKNQNLDKNSICSKLKIPPFFYQQYERQAQRWSSKGLKNALFDLAKLDLQLKSVNLSGPILVESFIGKLNFYS